MLVSIKLICVSNLYSNNKKSLAVSSFASFVSVSFITRIILAAVILSYLAQARWSHLFVVAANACTCLAYSHIVIGNVMVCVLSIVTHVTVDNAHCSACNTSPKLTVETCKCFFYCVTIIAKLGVRKIIEGHNCNVYFLTFCTFYRK